MLFVTTLYSGEKGHNINQHECTFNFLTYSTIRCYNALYVFNREFIMSLYDIIKKIQTTSSTNEKQEILLSNKDNTELKEFLRLTYCPSVVCNVGAKTYPTKTQNGVHSDFSIIQHIVYLLDSRQRTGHAAVATIQEAQNDLSAEYAELLQYVILKDARINVGAKSINKVWPNLLVDVPYQRCSLMDKNIIDRIERANSVYVQLKADGVFSVLSPEGMFTRNGSKFPADFQHYFRSIHNSDYCYEGEVVWYTDNADKPLPREISNGITNSIVQGGVVPDGHYPVFMVWNVLPYKDWKAGICHMTYEQRFNKLVMDVENADSVYVRLIPTTKTSGIQNVIAINSQYLSEGYEGVIVKFKEGNWKYNTSKDCIKVKVEVEVDMVIESVEEASGKNAGMVGRINVRSQDGKVWCGVNATGPDKARRDAWANRESLVGMVIECKANDIIDSSTKEGYSLFLGRADVRNIRTDKNTGDDFNRILAIFESAGVVKKFN